MRRIEKLFGRQKRATVEIQDTICWASDKVVRRAVMRIFAKYKATMRKLAA
jgi:hypothetical protein